MNTLQVSFKFPKHNVHGFLKSKGFYQYIRNKLDTFIHMYPKFPEIWFTFPDSLITKFMDVIMDNTTRQSLVASL